MTLSAVMWKIIKISNINEIIYQYKAKKIQHSSYILDKQIKLKKTMINYWMNQMILDETLHLILNELNEYQQSINQLILEIR